MSGTTPLADLLQALAAYQIEGDATVAVRAVCNDSRRVAPDDLYVAVRGTRVDGHVHVADAVARGAAAVVVEGDATAPAGARTVVRVPDSRIALGRLAAARHGWPSRRLALIGLTGTNGKTTLTYLLEAIVEEAGGRPAVIGTVDVRFGGTRRSADLTTPDAPTLQTLLAEAVDAGATHAALEVSSIALDQARIAGCEVAVATFTNLTQDHLDYHADLDSYFEAKALLFSRRGPAGAPRAAVVNLDDPRGAALVARCDAPVIGYGIDGNADVTPTSFVLTRAGIRARLATPAGEVDVSSRLVGRHNLENLLAATATALALDLPRDAIERGLRRVRRIPGRLERVAPWSDVAIYVDYAHTPDALARVLDAARSLTEQRVITVFGCGGDRDRTKRPLMGAAALAGSDVVVLTSDNPRTEAPAAIAADVRAGMTSGREVAPDALARAARGAYAVVLDRREAIRAAVRAARPGDVVLVAGKGHEDYQIQGTTKHAFDDRTEAAAAAAERQT